MLYAGKIVSKELIASQNQKEKMTQEIHIHQTLSHVNIVGFHSFFEDNHNVYIVLELCRKRSMMELHRRRKTLTEPETRYYMKQILAGVHYLHSNRIIHRDLKLGNLFLSDDLIVKIGDFGLAAKIEFDGERKKTLCGTPNYIAPEILKKTGHSFEVDIWSVGCIMYTLLVGKPPFETETLKETYAKIRKCDYKISAFISAVAKGMIVLMLQPEPSKRPPVEKLMQHPFMIHGYCPSSLPVSSLTMEPRFHNVDAMASGRTPLLETKQYNSRLLPKEPYSIASGQMSNAKVFNGPENFKIIKAMITKVLKSKPLRNNHGYIDEMTDPASQPLIWVSKWVDYSDKYGFGYQLCDEGVGVMFNDTTKLIMLPNGINVHYIDKNGDESYMTMDTYPKQYEKKMKLLSYFSRYMREHLVKTGAEHVRQNDTVSRIPHLHQWVRSTSGVLMQLNNGTVQMNFGDHTKIIMCPLMTAITYIDKDSTFSTYTFDTIEKNGCSQALFEKMHYALDKINVLLQKDL
ncbi:unnamed protein product [Acanthoscelides obtectus]|nr:unnamed protein product [Acanthoscelides obtectus]CAK1670402.1 Serine/threonine-protein kinase polo [Acanthoscelides obtectus]